MDGLSNSATPIADLDGGTVSDLWDLWPAGDARVLAVGDAGTVLACTATGCSRLHEDPSTFLYGLGTVGGRTLAVGWAGTVLAVDGTTVDALDAGTKRVLRAVVGRDDGTALVVGQAGAWLEYAP